MTQKKLLELGAHYVSDFLEAGASSEGRNRYSLDLYLDESIGAVRLGEVAPPESMWGQYWYRSGTNNTMRRELQGIVDEVQSRIELKRGDHWLDIACNDGTLLSFVPEGIHRVGIDPCDDSYVVESSKHGTIVQDYFSKEAWRKAAGDARAKVITCIAMFYDLDNPHSFIDDLVDVLDKDGVLVLQMSYTPLMVQQMAFDNICHEHVYYHSLASIEELFDQHNMRIVDATLNDTNGGSIRIYLMHNDSNPRAFATEQMRHVCGYRTDALLLMENIHCDIRNPSVWREFGRDLEKLRDRTVKFIRDARAQGKTVWGYGASTKGNTLLQYFGLTNEDIVAIAERSPYKWGKKTVGTEIPIVSEDEFRKAQPDYVLVLPWHFIDEFVKREADYLARGGSFIVPCPEFEVIAAPS